MQNKQVSVKKNFIMNAILTISSFVFPFITFPYISRVLLPEGIGRVSLAISVIAYFNMFAQLGIPTYGVKACAKVRDNKTELTRTAHELFLINIIMTLVSYVGLIIAIICIPKIREEKTLYLIVSMTILLSAIGMEWLYRALEEYTYITIRSIAFKLIAVIAMFLLVNKQNDYIVYAAISVFASSASYIWNFLKAKEFIDYKWLGNYDLKRHMKPVLIFFALACAATVYTNLDNVMLGFMKTDADVGYYNTAVKIKTALVCLITSLGTVLLPRASYYIENGNVDEFKRISAKAMHFVVLAAIPVTVFFVLFAREGILFISGEAFEGAILPMQLIMPTVLFIGITNIIGIEVMVPTGREKLVLYSTIVGAVIDLILNAILIPRYAAVGAAIGTLAAEFAVLLFQIISIKGESINLFRDISYWKICIATIAASTAALLIKTRNYPNFKTLLYSSAIFFCIYGAILYVLREDLVKETCDQILELPIFNEEKKKTLFFFCYGIILTCIILASTVLYKDNNILGKLLPFVRIIAYAGIALVIAINYARGKYRGRTLLIVGIASAIVILVTYKSGNTAPLLYWIVIVSAIDIELNEICKWSSIIHIVLIVLTVSLAVIGLIENQTITRLNGRVREYLGFCWTTVGPNLLLYSSLMLAYWRKEKISILECIAILGCAVFMYARTETKSAFILTVMLAFAMIILKYVPAIREYRAIYGITSAIAVPICSVGIIALTKCADFNVPVIQKINAVLTGRIQLGQDAIKKYGISLFGKNITWVGGNGIGQDGTWAYNYVDSSYVQILLNFGVVFLVLLVAYLVIVAINGIKKEDTYIALIMVVLIVHTTFDPQLILMEYNPFLMGLSYIGICQFSRTHRYDDT